MISDFIKQYGAVLISSWSNITYLTSYSGFSQTERECFLLITKNKKYLITDGRYSEDVKRETKGFEIIDTGANNFIHEDKNNILGSLSSIAVEEDNLTVLEYKSLKKIVKKIKGIDLSGLRIVKKEQEIINIKRACKIGDKAFNFIIKELKTGVTEKEIANKIEQFIKNSGAEVSFSPIVAFGKNSAFPHHVSTEHKLKKNQIVLFDFGAKVNNYCSDMSRTIFFGKADNEFIKMYSTVLKAQQNVVDFLKSKIINHESFRTDEVDKIARDYIVKHGYPLIPHSVGHGIGIEVHEAPFISSSVNDTQIKHGMVFSIEPGIYDQTYGGVRIEDLALVRKNKLELISRSRKEIIEVDYA